MQINGDNIYLKLHTSNVKVGEVLSVMSEGGYIRDPKTGQNIPIVPEVIGQIKVIQVTNAYSIGKAYGNTETDQLADAMTIKKGTLLQTDGYGATGVIIAPAELNFPQGMNTMVGSYEAGEGYIGDYVSAALIKHLLKSDKIQILDRSMIEIQQREINMGQTGEFDFNSALQYGKIQGARYIVKLTMLKPDVANITNNVPVKSAAQFGGAVARAAGVKTEPTTIGNTGVNITEILPDRMKIEKVKVQVTIVARVVDLQTGQALFTTDARAEEVGKPSTALDFYGFGIDVSDLTVNQGNFTHSVSGRAIDKAFNIIGPKLNYFFSTNL
ncbi:MAG: CsgG/HfaB family protein [Bacteroidetes bacterium]|nr:CsgG/HfaB family protein [Bacteroidota bacterium]